MQIHVVKLASVRTIVLCSSSSICIYGDRCYSSIPLKSKKRVHIRVHKRTSRVHKRVRKSTTEIHPQTAIMPNSACRGLAKSHERFIAWGIRLPIQYNVCTTGKPNQWQRPVPWIIMKPVVALRL